MKEFTPEGFQIIETSEDKRADGEVVIYGITENNNEYFWDEENNIWQIIARNSKQ